MPATTRKQQRFMAMAADPEGRKKLIHEGVKVPPVSVAKEFRHLSKKVRASDHLTKK